jgi:hypothetical protein
MQNWTLHWRLQHLLLGSQVVLCFSSEPHCIMSILHSLFEVSDNLQISITVFQGLSCGLIPGR